MRMHKNNTAQFKAQRIRVLRRDAHTCYYCGDDNATHVDHVIAKANGGGDEMDNLVAACARCNQLKGTKSQGAFLAIHSAPLSFQTVFTRRQPLRPNLAPVPASLSKTLNNE